MYVLGNNTCKLGVLGLGGEFFCVLIIPHESKCIHNTMLYTETISVQKVQILIQ